ncbi:MAG: hypothetical protein U0V74_11345 [Chitinophagales bacterium]
MQKHTCLVETAVKLFHEFCFTFTGHFVEKQAIDPVSIFNYSRKTE